VRTSALGVRQEAPRSPVTPKRPDMMAQTQYGCQAALPGPGYRHPPAQTPLGGELRHPDSVRRDLPGPPSRPVHAVVGHKQSKNIVKRYIPGADGWPAPGGDRAGAARPAGFPAFALAATTARFPGGGAEGHAAPGVTTRTLSSWKRHEDGPLPATQPTAFVVVGAITTLLCRGGRHHDNRPLVAVTRIIAGVARGRRQRIRWRGGGWR
jgi:hypothetical protein